MTAVIIFLFLILFVLIITCLMIKDAAEFIASKLININTNLENTIKILESLSKNKLNS